jgi:REP element-mobilizing transposase RayT
MEIYAWCIMTNHVHLDYRSTGEIPPEKILGYFKRHTSKAVVKAIDENNKESRREILLNTFKSNGART